MKRSVQSAILLLLALLLVATVFAACGKKEKKPTPETTEGQVTPEETTRRAPKTEPELPDVNYNGSELKVLVRPVDVCKKDIWLDSKDDRDEVDHAVWQRALYLESKFGIFIQLTESSDGNYEVDAQNAIIAGSCDFDLIACHGRAASSYAIHSCSYDWNDLKYVDLECDWWSHDALENWQVNGRNFMMTGDISTHYLRTAIAMFFNKDILDTVSITYPYQLVLDDAWTLEAWKTMATDAYNGMTTTGSGKLEDDSFAYTTGWWRGPMQLLYSTGHRVITGNTSDTFQLNVYDEITATAYDRYLDKFLFAGSCNTEAPSDYAKMQAAFRRSGVAFYDDTLDTSRVFKDVNFGIVPWPKYDENVDRYYTTLSSYANCFVVPRTVSDADRVSVALEAMAFFGHRNIVPMYYERVLSY